MNWKYKSVLAMAFSKIPYGDGLHYLFQRYVTRTLPISDEEFLENISVGRKHLNLLRNHENRPLSELQFFEFGSGRDLKFPLTYYSEGVDHQILSDVRRLVRPELVNDVTTKFKKFGSQLGFMRIPNAYIEHSVPGAWNRWMCQHGFDYRAPYDARKTEIQGGSIDCVTSISVLEHVPADDILAILRECHRLLKTDGWVLFRIDYTDHYASFDRNITPYNFLQYSDRQWSRWNSSLIYQNRLRHSDYVRLVEQSGFNIVDEQIYHGSKEDVECLRSLPLDSKYRAYSPRDLAICGWNVLLQKSV